MNAEETKVRGLLEPKIQYIVPLFQRIYSWEKKQWEMLWDDVIELYDYEDDSAHFIGSFVFAPVSTSQLPTALTRYTLIDGQQRLTTIMLLLAAIRDLLFANNSELSQDIKEKLLSNSRFGIPEDSEDSMKLLPTKNDRGTFAELVKQKPPQYQSNIRKAYTFFIEKITRRLKEPETTLDLEKFCNIIVDSLTAIQIVLGPGDNPHLIFESLNGKGAPLKPSDLIRNYIFMQFSEKSVQERAYHDHWLPMQERLTSEHILTLFMRHLVMQTGKTVRREDTYLRIQNYLERRGAGTPLEELVRIAHSSEMYLKIIEPAKEPNKELSLRFERLLELEVTTSHPLVLRLYSYFDRAQLNESDFLLCLDSIESFMIRRAFCLFSTRPLAKIFVNLCRDLNEANIVSSVLELLDKAGWPNDVQFGQGFVSNPIFQFDKAKTQYALQRLEESFGHLEPPSLQETTIEHVFPQNPDNEWHQQLSEDEYLDASRAIHRIGNLTLSAYNPNMSNKWFGEKKHVYAASNLELNRYFAPIAIWNLREITNRAQLLFQKAKAVWPNFRQ